MATPPPPPDPPFTVIAAATAAASIASTAPTPIPPTPTSTATPPRPIFPPNPRPPPPHPHPGTSHPFQAPFFSNHPHYNPANSRLSSNPNPNYPHLVSASHPHEVGATTTSTRSPAVIYPVASSGRGFLTKQTPAVTLPNPSSALYQSRPGLSYPRPPFGYSHSDLGPPQGMGYVTGRQTHATVAGVMPGVIKGVPVTGASSQSQHKITISQNPNSDCNGHKDISKDESAFTTIRDRKVGISDNASIYALCQSWLRNGFPEESQAILNNHEKVSVIILRSVTEENMFRLHPSGDPLIQYMDSVRSLPRPLPLSAQDVTSPVKKDDDKEEEEQDDGSVEHLTPQQLLQRHVKHAKRVRSRLREERLRRIARYKTRLALLLHPMVDPQLRSDIAPGN